METDNLLQAPCSSVTFIPLPTDASGSTDYSTGPGVDYSRLDYPMYRQDIHFRVREVRDIGRSATTTSDISTVNTQNICQPRYQHLFPCFTCWYKEIELPLQTHPADQTPQVRQGLFRSTCLCLYHKSLKLGLWSHRPQLVERSGTRTHLVDNQDIYYPYDYEAIGRPPR